MEFPFNTTKKEEYGLLNKAQKAELHEWRSKNKSTKGGKKKSGDCKFDTAKAIASNVDKTVNERMKSIEQEKSTNDDTEAYIMSVVDKHVGKSCKVVQISDTTMKPMPAAAAPMLRSIVKRAKNAKAGTWCDLMLQVSSITSTRRRYLYEEEIPLRGGDTIMQCSQRIKRGILVESKTTKRDRNSVK